MLRRLEGAGGGSWTSKEVIDSVDVGHASKVRGTMRAGHAHSFILKTTAEHEDVRVVGGGGGNGGGHGAAAAAAAAAAGGGAPSSSPTLLRFSLSTERELSHPPGPEDPPVNFRIKKRYRFNRKNEFLYELTAVKSGATLAAAQQAEIGRAHV